MDAVAQVSIHATVWRDEDGELHRGDGLPAVVLPNGHQEWYRHGSLHREDGPAMQPQDGRGLQWYVHGRHVYDPLDLLTSAPPDAVRAVLALAPPVVTLDLVQAVQAALSPTHESH